MSQQNKSRNYWLLIFKMDGKLNLFRTLGEAEHKVAKRMMEDHSEKSYELFEVVEKSALVEATHERASSAIFLLKDLESGLKSTGYDTGDLLKAIKKIEEA